IQEEKRETSEAQAELQDTEARYAATKERDEFVSAHNAKLQAAADHIDVLEERAANQEGAAKEATDAQITELQNAHDRAEESLDTVESADLLKWSDHRDNVKQAFNDLQAKIDQTK